MGNGAHVSMTRFCLPALVAALLSVSSGCVRSSGPSDIAQGRYFAAGSPDYDEFFLAVHRLQLEMANAPAEIAEARRALGEAVVSAADASNAQLAEKVKAVLDRLAERGVRTRVELRTPSPPDPPRTMALLTPSTSPAGADRQVLQGLEGAITRVLRFGAAMRLASSQLAQLRAAIPRLETGIDATFRDRGRAHRAQIANNLRDAERVSVLMLARAEELGKPSAALADELDRTLVVHSKALPSVPPSEAPEAPPEAPRVRARASQDPPPRLAPAAAGSKPKAAPEPPKSADFEP